MQPVVQRHTANSTGLLGSNTRAAADFDICVCLLFVLLFPECHRNGLYWTVEAAVLTLDALGHKDILPADQLAPDCRYNAFYLFTSERVSVLLFESTVERSTINICVQVVV